MCSFVNTSTDPDPISLGAFGVSVPHGGTVELDLTDDTTAATLLDHPVLAPADDATRARLDALRPPAPAAVEPEPVHQPPVAPAVAAEQLDLPPAFPAV